MEEVGLERGGRRVGRGWRGVGGEGPGWAGWGLLLPALLLGACSAPPDGKTGDTPGEGDGMELLLAEAFAADSAVGTMVVRRLSDGREWVHGPVRADSQFLPASSFKIMNAAIALETGVVDPDELFPWDGVAREIPGWNQDHTLGSAMPASAVPVYQEVARRIGIQRMEEWLGRIGYGNGAVGGGVDQFWLTGDLRISAREQVDVLERLVTGALPFSPQTVEQVASMTRLEEGPGYVLHAKTGLAGGPQVGWWVGWTTHRGESWVFALNMWIPDSQRDLPKRTRIGRRVLAAVGALPGTTVP